MKSDVIAIDNKGTGFKEAVEATKKLAEFNGLSATDSLHLQLFTEEMLSMILFKQGKTVNAKSQAKLKLPSGLIRKIRPMISILQLRPLWIRIRELLSSPHPAQERTKLQEVSSECSEMLLSRL